MQDGRKAVWSIPYVSVAFFLSLKHDFIAYLSSKRSDCIFEIHRLWQLGFSRMYSNCLYSCSFQPESIKIGQSFHKMCSNNLLNFQESTTILNTRTKKVWKLIVCPSYIMKGGVVGFSEVHMKTHLKQPRMKIKNGSRFSFAVSLRFTSLNVLESSAKKIARIR